MHHLYQNTLAFFHALGNVTPVKDKIGILFGGGVATLSSTASSLPTINLTIGLLVGLATLAVMVLRSIIAWREVFGDKSKNSTEEMVDAAIEKALAATLEKAKATAIETVEDAKEVDEHVCDTCGCKKGCKEE